MEGSGMLQKNASQTRNKRVMNPSSKYFLLESKQKALVSNKELVGGPFAFRSSDNRVFPQDKIRSSMLENKASCEYRVLGMAV